VRIEAVTVCVDYADFLEVTLSSILAAVDELVVVTTAEDHRTRKLCIAHGVRSILSTAMYADGRKFSLGAAINSGLRFLKLDDWALVIDADIVLPRNTRETLNTIGLDPKNIYGIDRVHCRGRFAWDQFITQPRPVRQWEVPLLRDFEMGARIRVPGSGYVPCGYFQFWNAGWTKIRDYPIDDRGTAEGSDMIHSLRWDRCDRTLIPDLVGVELGTDLPGDVGVNWSGRRTPEFSIEEGPYRR
jgi:glycosyltransferase involved in cell wall biosynthesis